MVCASKSPATSPLARPLPMSVHLNFVLLRSCITITFLIAMGLWKRWTSDSTSGRRKKAPAVAAGVPLCYRRTPRTTGRRVAKSSPRYGSGFVTERHSGKKNATAGVAVAHECKGPIARPLKVAIARCVAHRPNGCRSRNRTAFPLIPGPHNLGYSQRDAYFYPSVVVDLLPAATLAAGFFSRPSPFSAVSAYAVMASTMARSRSLSPVR